MMIEDLYKTTLTSWKMHIIEMNMALNKVNIEFLREQLDKALTDIEILKDKVRQNGNGTY